MNFSHLVKGFNPVGHLNFFSLFPWIYPSYTGTATSYPTRPTYGRVPVRQPPPVPFTYPVPRPTYTAPSTTTRVSTPPVFRPPTTGTAITARTPGRATRLTTPSFSVGVPPGGPSQGVVRSREAARRINAPFIAQIAPVYKPSGGLLGPVSDFGTSGLGLEEGTKDLLLYAALAGAGFALWKVLKGSFKPRRRTVTTSF